MAISSMRTDFMDALGSVKMAIMDPLHHLGQRVLVIEDQMRTMNYRDQGGPTRGQDDDVPPF